MRKGDTPRCQILLLIIKIIKMVKIIARCSGAGDGYIHLLVKVIELFLTGLHAALNI
jgi:hypothetical protein